MFLFCLCSRRIMEYLVFVLIMVMEGPCLMLVFCETVSILLNTLVQTSS